MLIMASSASAIGVPRDQSFLFTDAVTIIDSPESLAEYEKVINGQIQTMTSDLMITNTQLDGFQEGFKSEIDAMADKKPEGIQQEASVDTEKSAEIEKGTESRVGVLANQVEGIEKTDAQQLQQTRTLNHGGAEQTPFKEPKILYVDSGEEVTLRKSNSQKEQGEMKE